ncbi:hypothetical protein [Streptomyces sp. GESEQ-35]|uniref:hypothetical protein n=1 Tax=Streptomyces sp. GESEQ-35 TaxID=2812657 RepID=UPI0027E395A6|nr:hypothetical protein [Streptomyces sp. GESEQ-35]
MWRVEVQADATEGEPYELIDRFLERGIAEAGLATADELAAFFALEPALVRQALQFLAAIRHIEEDRHGRLALTELGLRSVRDEIRCTVTQKDRRKLYLRGHGHRLDQRDLAADGKTVTDQDAWLCFADESGQMLRPPKARTWSRRGHTPCVRVRAAGSGRISLAGLVCYKAGQRTRLVFRMLVHHGRNGEKKGFRERDFASLLDAAHQQLGGNIVLVWDNYSHHLDAAMRELIGNGHG